MKKFRISPFHLTGLLFAWALKSWYSRAGPEELGWILTPTCRLAELLSGISFVKETGSGWISHDYRLIVGPGCSGMNFLIIAFATLLFTTVHRVRTPAARSLCLAGSIAGAWALTITTNASRLLVTVMLRHMDIYGGLVTEARVHRAAGTIVYCLSLVLVYLAVDRWLDRLQDGGNARRRQSALVPLIWYLGVTIGVPVVNRAWQDDTDRFIEHSAFVVAICTLVALAVAARGWRHRDDTSGMTIL